MQRAALDGLVDAGDQRAVLGLEGIGVAGLGGLLEAVKVGLDGARQASVLVTLSGASEDPLLL